MFNSIIVENFSNPQYVGQLNPADETLSITSPVCGDRVLVTLNIENEKIKDVLFQAWGCATSIATANLFCQLIHKKTKAEITKLDATELNHLLGDLEPSQAHCLDMLHELVQKLQS